MKGKHRNHEKEQRLQEIAKLLSDEFTLEEIGEVTHKARFLIHGKIKEQLGIIFNDWIKILEQEGCPVELVEKLRNQREESIQSAFEYSIQERMIPDVPFKIGQLVGKVCVLVWSPFGYK